MREQLKLLQGTLDVLVMKALAFGPRHGYAVAQWIRRSSEGDLEIEDGALYTALKRMEKRRWLASEWGVTENNRNAKYYRLTPAGEKQLGVYTETWSAYADAVFRVLASGAGEEGK